MLFLYFTSFASFICIKHQYIKLLHLGHLSETLILGWSASFKRVNQENIIFVDENMQ